MKKENENLTAREFVWEHRIRQRIALEQIIMTVGNPKERYRANQFLTSMKQAHPLLFEDIEQYTLDLFKRNGQDTPELFDDSEYTQAKGLKTALKMPNDIQWEERIIRRTVDEYHDLYHPCEEKFYNAMQGLQFVYNLFPEIFIRAKTKAYETRTHILTCEIECQCGCCSMENCKITDSFSLTKTGRLKMVSKRIKSALQAIEGAKENKHGFWSFFLDRVNEITPEMLPGYLTSQ